MGYDMYVVTEDGTRLADQLHPWSGQPSFEGDREAWRDWFAKRTADHLYLRRNISGQPHLRADLVAVGAAFDGYDYRSGWGSDPHVMGRDFPEFPGEDHFEYDDEGERVPTTPAGRAYEDQVEAHLKWRPEHPGIPIHKLSDNSGWWVTADECKEALEAIRKYASEHDGTLPCSLREEYGDDLKWDPWEDTLAFLESAAKHGGFRVY